MGLPEHRLPSGADSIPRRLDGLDRRVAENEAALTANKVLFDHAGTVVVGPPALVSGWNTLATATIAWPAQATSCAVTGQGWISLVEASSGSSVYGGRLRVVVGGVAAEYVQAISVYDAILVKNVTTGSCGATEVVTAPTAVTVALQFYPWHESWYPYSASTRAVVTATAQFG